MMMKTTSRNVAAVAALAVAAYLAGEADLFSGLSGFGEQAVAAQQKDSDRPMRSGSGNVMSSEQQMAWMEAGMPNQHHKMLQPMIGEWRGEYHIKMDPNGEPMVTQGTATREWILGGRFVLEHVTADMPTGEFEGFGLVGYDNVDGVYRSFWIDNTSTTMMTATGTLNPQNNTMKMWSEMRDPMSGKLLLQESQYVMKGDQETMTGWTTTPDGTKYKSFWGSSTRVSDGHPDSDGVMHDDATKKNMGHDGSHDGHDHN